MRVALLMILIAGFSGVYASLADQKNGAPVVRLSCDDLTLFQDAAGLFHGRTWKVRLGLDVQAPDGWKIAWCDDSKARVLIEDSTGYKTGDVSSTYWSPVDENGYVILRPRSWKPAAGSQWMSVKGEMPLLVSLKNAVSEAVKVKLVKGFSAPVVLKGAGFDEKDGKPVDVQATLKVKEFVDAGEKGGKLLTLELSAGRRLVFQEFGLQTVKGQPVIVEDRGSASRMIFGSRSWRQTLQMDDAPGDELKVNVQYASELRLVMGVIDSHVSLSGFADGKNGVVGGKDQPEKVDALKAVGAAAAVASHPEEGEAPAFKAELEGMGISGEKKVINNVRQDTLFGIDFRIRLKAKGQVFFGGRPNLSEQSLEVTDSTGRALKPAVFDLGHLSNPMDNGASYVMVNGRVPEVASPGAEWVRVKGVLSVPICGRKESPVYELPLAKDSELHVPVPGRDEGVNEAVDVATAGDAPTCRLWLEEVERMEDGDMKVKITLQVDGSTFDFEKLDLEDGKGKSLNAIFLSSSRKLGDSRSEWSRTFSVRNATGMKCLHVKMKYRVDVDMVPVPVDLTVGLGGPVAGKSGGKKVEIQNG